MITLTLSSENCPFPSTSWDPAPDIVNRIRTIAHQYGSITTFRVYMQHMEKMPSSLRSELQSYGLSLIDCPHQGRKDVADKMIIGELRGQWYYD